MNRLNRGRRARLAALAAVGVAVLAGDGWLISTVGHAQKDDTLAANYGIYNGQVRATADREQVGSTTNAGFTEGLVDNFYPFARVNVAVAGTSAAASPADTGPFAQAVFAGQVPCPVNQSTVCIPGETDQQPQYVYAQNPGTGNPQPYAAGPATARASAAAVSAAASATYGAVGATATAPVGSNPDGSDGGTANVASYFDSSLGFVTIGDSRVAHASYGAGVLVIDKVHVSVLVSTTGMGTFANATSITVGGASVNGVPVTIDQNGVTVQQQNVPVGATLQSVTAQVNQALSQAGLSVHTVAPQTTQQGTNLHVDAVGVVVDSEQPVTPPGTPTQFARHTLGEVVLDNEATTSGSTSLAPLSSDAGGGGLSSAGGSTSSTFAGGTSTSNSSTTIIPIKHRPSTVRPVSAVVTVPPPRWLLLAYLAWQALMVALVASMYLRRSALRRAA